MDIVFDQKFPVVGEELPVTMGFENIIFVMEDVDAASPIVQSRDRSKRKKKRGTKTTVKVLKYNHRKTSFRYLPGSSPTSSTLIVAVHEVALNLSS